MVVEQPALYDHQSDMVNRLRKSIAKHRASILQAPPGTGKTRIAKWMLGAATNREPKPDHTGKSLFAVHRRGLVDNASNSFNEEPVLPHGILMSGVEHNASRAVQVASIDTLLSWFCEGGDYSWDETFDLIIFDECVTGDAIVETELGPMRLDEIPFRKPKTVRSYSKDKGEHFAKILNWTYKGERDTIEVHTNHGKVQCTPDHEIYTRRGWLQGKDLSDTDEILVSADAGSDCLNLTCSQGTGTPSESPVGSGKPPLRKLTFTHQNAFVGVGRERDLRSRTGRSGVSNERYTQRITQMGIAGVPVISRLNSLVLSGKRYLERFSEILLSDIRTRAQLRHGFTARTATSKRNGLSIRRLSSIASTLLHEWLQTLAGESSLSARLQGAILRLSQFMTLLLNKAQSECLSNGLTELATSGLLGGYAMTGRSAIRACSFTRKGSPSKTTNSLPTGSATTSARQQCARTSKRRRISSTLQVGHKSKLGSESPNTSQSACDTSWSRVTKIVPANPTDVYDIEVEGSHCFFANNLLVHNCHSHHSKLQTFLTAHNQKRLAKELSLPYVIGLTATPQAQGLADIYHEIVRGPETQWLIDNKFLSPFRYFRATQGKLGLLVKKGDEYTKDSVCNAMEGLSGDLVRDWKKFAEGRATVGFFPRRTHAKEAQEALCAAGIKAEYVDGETDDDRRQSLYKWLNDGTIDYLCNVGVVERGTDIPRIGCVQMCTAVGNVVRWLQMIGRGSRVHPDVPDTLVLDHGNGIERHGFFEDSIPWTLDWSERPSKERVARPKIECPKCCVARGTMILTERGEVPIEEVKLSDRVWDGVEFCFHGGTCCNGIKEVIHWGGVTLTPDHKVLTNDGWKEAEEAKIGEWRPVVGGVGRTPVRTIDDSNPYRACNRSKHRSRSRLRSLRKEGVATVLQDFATHPARLRTLHDQVWEGLPGVACTEGQPAEVAMSTFGASRLQKLRRSRDRVQVCVGCGGREVDSSKPRATTQQIVDDRPNRQQWTLRRRQSSLGYDANSTAQSRLGLEISVSTEVSFRDILRNADIEPSEERVDSKADRRPLARKVRWSIRHSNMAGKTETGASVCEIQQATTHLHETEGNDSETDSQSMAVEVWDIRNAGPRNRYTANGVIVSNCAVYRGGKCRNCGYEPNSGERRSQGLEFDGAELQEVKRKDKAKSKPKSFEEIMVSALYACGRSGRTWKQALAIAYSKAREQGMQFRVPKQFEVGGRVYKPVPYGSHHASRRVVDLYDFVNRN